MTNENIAKICYEANKAFCEIIKEEVLSWEQCKDSTIKGVEAFNKNCNISTKAIHDNWVKDKLADNWKYGPIKDFEKKEHPCIKDYHDLSLTQRFKDNLFLAICRCFNNV